MSPEQKFADRDVRFIEPSELTTGEECAWLMVELEKVAARIESQLDHARTTVREGGAGDDRWYVNAKFALRNVKTKRLAVQERRGYLSRRRKADDQKRLEEVFVRLARERLPGDAFHALMTDALAEVRSTQPKETA